MRLPRLSPTLLATAVEGRNLLGPLLSDQLAEGPQLVVFLRHFG